MSNGAYAGLRRGPRASAPDPDEKIDPEDCESDANGKPKKDEDMTDTNNQAALEAAKTDGHKAGFAAANARFNTVLASEHYAGREKLAATLLGNENLSADDIITALAAAPAATTEANANASEDAAREEMRNALGQDQNSGIEANGGGAPSKSEAASSVWDKAIAKTFPNSKAVG